MAMLAPDEARAAALLAMLSLCQLAAQARAHVAWLASYGLAGRPQEVLAHWLALIAAHPTPPRDA